MDASESAAVRHISATVKEAGTENIPALLFHCLRKYPDDILLVQGVEATEWTSSQILRRAVRISRFIQSRGITDVGHVILIGRNSVDLLSAVLGTFFAGVAPLALDTKNGSFEIQHYLSITQPRLILHDSNRTEEVKAALSESQLSADMMLLKDIGTTEGVDEVARFSESVDDFQLVQGSSTAVLVPTSGSTGKPKVAQISHRGLIKHLDSIWTYYKSFPKPMRRALLLSSAQWLTWWTITTNAIVHRVTMVYTTESTPQHVVDVIRQCQVEWALIPPMLTSQLRDIVSPEKIPSMRGWLVTGSPITTEALKSIQARLPSGAWVRQGFGMTELAGFACVPDIDTPYDSVGTLLPFFRCKIVDPNGKELGPNEAGQLYIKSEDALFEKYLRNDEATKAAFTEDGWFKSGDVFRKDEQGFLYFAARIKFMFKVDGFQVAPTEVEKELMKIPGVQSCVVVEGTAGAAALLVRSSQEVNEEMVSKTVRDRLAPYKHLRGGVAFVASLPLTHSGKVDRGLAAKLYHELLQDKLIVFV